MTGDLRLVELDLLCVDLQDVGTDNLAAQDLALGRVVQQMRTLAGVDDNHYQPGCHHQQIGDAHIERLRDRTHRIESRVRATPLDLSSVAFPMPDRSPSWARERPCVSRSWRMFSASS